MGGTPCFAGTRVLIRNLFDHIASGQPLNEFFQDHPAVTREQVTQVLEMALDKHLPKAAAAA